MLEMRRRKDNEDLRRERKRLEEEKRRKDEAEELQFQERMRLEEEEFERRRQQRAKEREQRREQEEHAYKRRHEDQNHVGLSDNDGAVEHVGWFKNVFNEYPYPTIMLGTHLKSFLMVYSWNPNQVSSMVNVPWAPR